MQSAIHSRTKKNHFYKLALPLKHFFSSTMMWISLYDETNNNGTKIMQFAMSKGFNVRRTTFPHKDIHKETWYSAQ